MDQAVDLRICLPADQHVRGIRCLRQWNASAPDGSRRGLVDTRSRGCAVGRMAGISRDPDQLPGAGLYSRSRDFNVASVGTTPFLLISAKEGGQQREKIEKRERREREIDRKERER